MFAFPTQGHIAPLMILADKLAAMDFSITFVSTDHNILLMKEAGGASSTQHLVQNIHLVGLPDGLPENHERYVHNQDYMKAVFGMKGVFEQLMERLVRESPPVSCIISDTFLPWTRDVAVKFQIPRVLFWTCSASAYSLLFHTHLLVAEGILPLKDGEAEKIITCIPAFPSLRITDLPTPIRVSDTSDWFFKFMQSQLEHIDEASWVLVNTFYDLEDKVIDSLQTIAPVHPIGPLVRSPCETKSIPGESIWREEVECLHWLDSQSVSSVLYISFGSVSILDVDQIRELAAGLEASKQPVLWAFHMDLSFTDIFPPGFLLNMKGRILVIHWAPQMRVLSHPSLGGFLTHCGWNSTLQSITAGVPMIAWPQIAEQAINCKFIVDEWKIGIRLLRNGRVAVERADVEDIVRELMLEEKGGVLRQRIMELKDAAKRAMMAQGSSEQNLQSFVQDMLKRTI